MTPHPVLIVEDDDDIREGLIELLGDEGYEARGAANGRDALALLAGAENRPCLIILDLMMPIMDGRAFREEQLRRPDVSAIPVIVISAYKDGDGRLDGLNISDCLAKPLDLGALLGVVRAHCPGQSRT
jgi:DNA-binding response OmpR family regulator